MKLSFGMIFSIILIVIFIAFAFYAIKTFLELQDSIRIAQFVDGLQSAVDKAWRGVGESSTSVEYLLPSKIEFVCFKDDEYENLFFRSKDFIEGGKIEHINITKITKTEDPFCIENIKGKVKMRIKKDYGEALVEIIRE